jgi:hypothetical protein
MALMWFRERPMKSMEDAVGGDTNEGKRSGMQIYSCIGC